MWGLKNMVLFACLLSLACYTKAQNAELVEELKCYAKSQMVHDSIRHKSFSINEGPNLVFEFLSNNAGEPGNNSIAETKVLFQIDQNVDRIDWNVKEVAKLGIIYIQLCQCQDEGIQFATSGFVRAEKTAESSWTVEFDLMFKGAKTGKVYHIAENRECILQAK